MNSWLIVPAVFYFLNIYPSPVVEEDQEQNELYILLIKQRWHTGIVFEVQKIDTAIWSEVNDFSQFKYVDVGWGDEEFYQYPGDFDLGLAVKALFYPTSSTIRVEGFNFDLLRYADISDFAVKIPLSRNQFNLLSEYISNTYLNDKNGNAELLTTRYDGNIKYYKANGKYHLFNTCNTWIAEGLEKSGFNINPSGVILAEDLLVAADNFGIILKSEDKNQE